jgi:hypothetical protein
VKYLAQGFRSDNTGSTDGAEFSVEALHELTPETVRYRAYDEDVDSTAPPRNRSMRIAD